MSRNPSAPGRQGHEPGQQPGREHRKLTPLDRFEGPLSRRVYESVRAAILSLAYRPGERLRKRDICAALGVSRSPVSEAMARLATEGLVRVVPQAGTYVAGLSMAEVRQGAFLREALELAAVEALAPRITEEQLASLRRSLRIQAAHAEHGDSAAFYAEDATFHRLILDATGYPRLAELAATSWVQVDRARQLLLPQPGRMRETLEEHRRIVEALEARDPEAARAAMRRHLRQLLTYLEPLEQSRPEFFEASS